MSTVELYHRQTIKRLEDENQALRDENKRLRGAIVWALGYTDFRAREEGEGAYWWRSELRRRAALTPEQIEQALAALTPQPHLTRILGLNGKGRSPHTTRRRDDGHWRTRRVA